MGEIDPNVGVGRNHRTFFKNSRGRLFYIGHGKPRPYTSPTLPYRIFPYLMAVRNCSPTLARSPG